jgi:uncharacterized protein YggU (UPF0235/DUF167 family)
MTAGLAVRVQPGARRAGLKGWAEDGSLRLAVAARPEGGRANRAVEELLAEVLDVPRRAVSVTRGAASRSKWIEIRGLDADEVKRRIGRRLEREGEADGG